MLNQQQSIANLPRDKKKRGKLEFASFSNSFNGYSLNRACVIYSLENYAVIISLPPLDPLTSPHLHRDDGDVLN